ncbi:unnamed protein product [Caenorhabditis auriculariae]|uniref:TAR DNA-binding protein 43 N-terminal domain-containing protein n=1 Tax=Caenorhabditis auriculariae TaxID=2777116 RepID=A0A8S1HBB7_9PELO|nr:unnamed protein product [Caenorhabditis auriculariae]
MSSNVGKVRRLRIQVEPVDVELDEDDGILWTSLQTAFPGCSGMFYREKDADCKSAVRFDGKKFQAPGGAWNDRDYFVTLSQRCHASMNGLSGQNVSNYELATKQFERSVHAVQRMLATSKVTPYDLSHLRKHYKERQDNADMKQLEEKRMTAVVSVEPVVHIEHSQKSAASPPMVDDPIQERTRLLSSLERQLTPIEQQFVDLARISTAKDSIIDAHRTEIGRLNDQLRLLEKDLKTKEGNLSDAEALIKSQEEELHLLRGLGREYATSTEKIKTLEEQLNKNEKDLKDLQNRLDASTDRIKELETVNENLQARLETSTNKLFELDEMLQIAQSSKELLMKELDQLRPLADSIGLDDVENVPTYVEAISGLERLRDELAKVTNEATEVRSAFEDLQAVHGPVIEQNSSLTTRNKELDARVARIDEEMHKLNDDWKRKFDEKQSDWGLLKSEAETEVASLRQQMSQLQLILDAASRDAADNARRVDELTAEKSELIRAAELSEIKGQESLKRQVRNLTEDLREAEERVSELSGLVASLASEANNSRRDITDLL